MRAIPERCAVFSAMLAFAGSPVWSSPAPPEAARSETGQTITADELVGLVIEANPGLAALQAAADAATYRVDTAGSLDDPVLSYAVAPLTANAGRGLNQNVDFSQKIPWPGSLAARESAAQHDSVAAYHDVAALKLQVIAQTISAYAEWRFVDEGLSIHHATQVLLDELIATTQSRYAAGSALKQDALQAEVERAGLDEQLLRLVRQRVIVQARINALLNRLPDAPLPAAVPMPLRSAPPVLKILQSLALGRHPELLGLDAKISASKSHVAAAEKAFYPDFQLGVSYNSFWDNADKRPSIGVSINVPLNRSKRKSELNRARAESRRAEWTLVKRRAELLSNVAQARARVLEAQASVFLYKDRLGPLAEEFLAAALADYQSGSGTFLNVITAEQRKLSTDLQLARALADSARRIAELEQWVGGPIRFSMPVHKGVQQ